MASTFDSEIWLSRNGRRVNAKSIMGVMMLAAGKGSRVGIETSGSDEDAALEALKALIADRFGEDE
jgi:phosphocarrier protein